MVDAFKNILVHQHLHVQNMRSKPWFTIGLWSSAVYFSIRARRASKSAKSWRRFWSVLLAIIQHVVGESALIASRGLGEWTAKILFRWDNRDWYLLIINWFNFMGFEHLNVSFKLQIASIWIFVLDAFKVRTSNFKIHFFREARRIY